MLPNYSSLLLFFVNFRMKTLIVCFLLAGLPFADNAQTTSPEEKILLDIENQRNEAIATHNDALLSNLYDEQFHGVNTSGAVVQRTMQLEFFKSNNPFVLFSTDEMKATVYGATALVRGKLISKSKSGNILGQTRFLHVYLKKNDQWKIIESHDTGVIKE